MADMNCPPKSKSTRDRLLLASGALVLAMAISGFMAHGVPREAAFMAGIFVLAAVLWLDRGYCSRHFVEGLRGHGVVPHPAPQKDRRLLGVKVRSKAHQLSQKCRRKIEEIFGWAKTTGCFRKSRYCGVERTHAVAQYLVAACNLVRMARLSLGPPTLARA